ncbi:GNAT family N-acetyltransferase [Eudoraea sp.]|uniref:GNAT family N-acetyltransferase n=1 Tax=Eudoraea sp. TaxID=1979955 RepID=UPI003C75D36D
MIRCAKILEIPEILGLTKACAKQMEKRGIFQWNEEYPSIEAFENDISRKELFVLKSENTLIGCITITTYMDEEYVPIKWLTPNENNIYIHRLAVDPKFQGKGYAQILMNFAENYALENKYISIRLDTFSQNKRNQNFYAQRGYQKLGNVYFPKQSHSPFYCYELVL